MDNVRAKRIAKAIVVLTGLLVIVVAGGRMLHRVRNVDVDREIYPIRGLDISSHNGKPDFNKIVSDGVDFVYLKASEGINFRDRTFMRNYHAARQAGLKVGAYHFFRFDRDGIRQADNFLNAIADCELDLPLVIDLEESHNSTDVSTEIIIERFEAMLSTLRSEYGPVVIYTNKGGNKRFVRGRFDDVPLWICSFTDPPLARQRWLLWQHSHRGSVAGVDGNVDLDTFNGNREQWEAWVDSVRNTIIRK